MVAPERVDAFKARGGSLRKLWIIPPVSSLRKLWIVPPVRTSWARHASSVLGGGEVDPSASARRGNTLRRVKGFCLNFEARRFKEVCLKVEAIREDAGSRGRGFWRAGKPMLPRPKGGHLKREPFKTSEGVTTQDVLRFFTKSRPGSGRCCLVCVTFARDQTLALPPPCARGQTPEALHPQP